MFRVMQDLPFKEFVKKDGNMELELSLLAKARRSGNFDFISARNVYRIASNDFDDQSIIRSYLPDNSGKLSDYLPSLRTGEANKIPSRVVIYKVTPRPDSIHSLRKLGVKLSPPNPIFSKREQTKKNKKSKY